MKVVGKTPGGQTIATAYVKRAEGEGTEVFILDSGGNPCRMHRRPNESVDEMVRDLKSGK